MKRGLEFVVLVSLIIGIVSGIILVSYLYSLTGSLEKKTDLEACRLSVIANSRTSGKLSIFEAPVSCPAPRATIEYTDAKASADVIAKEMKDCWYKMGEGKLSVFGRDWVETSTSCLVCSEFSLKNDLPVNVLKERLQNKMPLSQQSYLDYFSVLNLPKAPSADLFFIDIGPEGPKPLLHFHNSTSYFVLFVRQQKSLVQNFFSPLSDKISALFASLTSLEPITDTQTFFIIPREKVADLSITGNFFLPPREITRPPIKICKNLYWEQGGDHVWK